MFCLKNKKNSNPEGSTVNQVKKPSVPKPVDEKKKQHDALMDEFKKVHRKMFANHDIQNEDSSIDENGVGDNLVSYVLLAFFVRGKRR